MSIQVNECSFYLCLTCTSSLDVLRLHIALACNINIKLYKCTSNISNKQKISKTSKFRFFDYPEKYHTQACMAKVKERIFRKTC